MRSPFIGLCIASLVSSVPARAEYSANQAARMAAARAALEQKLYELDHQQAQRPSDTITVAAATQPVKSAINPTHTVTIKPAALQSSSVATIPTEATPSGADDGTRISRKWTQHLYTEIDLGGVYQQENTTLYQSTANPVTATFNLGIRGNVALGYDISKSFAVEFNTGVLWNSMDKAGPNTLDSQGTSFDTYTVPFMATVIYKVPTKGSWYPYVGVSVGGAASIAAIQPDLISPIYTDCNFVFAYQAEAGLEYKLTKNFSADIAYQFLGTTDPTWHVPAPAVTPPPGAPPLPTQYTFTEKGFYTHSFVLSLTWHF